MVPEPWTVEISAADVDKAAALAELCDDLGIEASEVVAFGDYPNDLPMLASAGRALVSVLAYAGRPGEALVLIWSDVGERTILVERAAALGEVKQTKPGRHGQYASLRRWQATLPSGVSSAADRTATP
jgi:haloacid dehalogenase-like hydrolase